MKKVLIILIGIVIITQSFTCNKKDDTVTPTTTVEITVKDGNSWSASNTSLSISSAATINLYATQTDVTNNTPKYTATTDQTGVAKIPVNFQSQYLLTVQKGNAKNIINGLLVIGTFQSQAEIANSASQATAVVGGPKFADVNGDGKIDSNDKVTADVIIPIQSQNVTKTSIIY